MKLNRADLTMLSTKSPHKKDFFADFSEIIFVVNLVGVF